MSTLTFPWQPSFGIHVFQYLFLVLSKTFYEQREWVEKVIPSSTKYKNKWAVAIFGKWQISRSVIAPVLDPGGLFKGYDLHKVSQLSTSIEEIDAMTLNYWLSKFVMEVAKKSGEREIHRKPFME